MGYKKCKHKGSYEYIINGILNAIKEVGEVLEDVFDSSSSSSSSSSGSHDHKHRRTHKHHSHHRHHHK